MPVKNPASTRDDGRRKPTEGTRQLRREAFPHQILTRISQKDTVGEDPTIEVVGSEAEHDVDKTICLDIDTTGRLLQVVAS